MASPILRDVLVGSIPGMCGFERRPPEKTFRELELRDLFIEAKLWGLEARKHIFSSGTEARLEQAGAA